MPQILSISAAFTTSDSVTLAYEVNVPSGTIWAVAVPAGETAPSAPQIMQGLNYLGQVAPSTASGISVPIDTMPPINGLTFQNYDFHAVMDHTIGYSELLGGFNIAGHSFDGSLSVSSVTSLFSDNFASGDLSHTENGVNWTSSTRTSVVSDLTSWGDNSLEFDWAGSAYAEQRLSFSQKYAEIWYREVVYFHPDFSIADDSWNNKVIKSWGGVYGSGTVDTSMGMEFRGQAGGSYMGIYAVFGHRWDPAGVSSHGAPTSGDEFYRQDREPGTEVEYIFRIKVDETPSDFDCYYLGGDGAVQVWKNGVKVYDLTTIKCYPQDGVAIGMDAHYLWGWWNSVSNGTFDSTNVKLNIRDYQIATSNIWGVT